MKLLIVLGLIPLISAQQMGYFDFPQGRANTYGSRGYGNSGKKYNSNNMWGLNNNNNMWGLPTGIGGQPSYSNNQYQKNENLPGLDGVNTALIGQMRSMTDAVESSLQNAAQDPRIPAPVIDDTIKLLNLGTNAAEMALLDSTKLLNDAIEGKVQIKAGKEGLAAAKAASDEAFNKLASKSGYRQRY